MAEQLGMIVDFDLAVAQTVVKLLATAPAGVNVAVNVSANSLIRPGFTEALLALTAQTPRLRRRIMLEITETGALGDLGAADRIVARLRKAGHAVCIDDFGAGAASLDYLRRLNVDIVKMDGRYIQNLGSASRDATIMKHVVTLCRELGVSVIAEMVETRQAARLARDLGVDLGQGWFFGKPLAKPAIGFGKPWPLLDDRL